MPAEPCAAAAETYRLRRAHTQARCRQAQQLDRRLGAAKLTGAVVLLGLAWLALIEYWFAGTWLWLPLAGLVALFVWHDRVLTTRRRAEQVADHYERGLARLEDRWSGTGDSGERFRDGRHAYAADLDLFGTGSLFELLSQTRTAMGQQRLAAWMLAPAPPVRLHERQQQVEALRERVDLREAVAAVAADLDHSVDPERLRSWAAGRPSFVSGWAQAGFALVGAGALALLIFGFATGQFAYIFLLVVAEAVLLQRLEPRLHPVLAERGANGAGLQLFAGVLELLPAPPAGAAAALRRLATLSDWVEARGSLLGRGLDFLLLYSVQLAYAADGWRRRHGSQVDGWLEAVAEFEALLSLAGYAYEHPDDPFAEVQAESEPCFRGEDLGHPLLPLSVCVRNSVHLEAASRIWLVSGSNMSGKSTLLRTVGLNAVLAQMGAPVRAARLRLTPLAVGTCLRTADSLQLGRSGFYAEILRLRQILQLTDEPLPLLFLFDELLDGTNSHDRVVGGEGLLRALLARPAIGLISTHDLALTGVAAGLTGVRNVHFEDQIEGNDVRFDHRLRPGVVTRSNALALMRIVGLDV
ncbi:MAG TPA: mismatch repair protein [Terriglobales bacterium]|nr:mismatch repair protein [Terriglobales bacterium]